MKAQLWWTITLYGVAAILLSIPLNAPVLAASGMCACVSALGLFYAWKDEL